MASNISDPMMIVNWLAIGLLTLCIAVGLHVAGLTITVLDSKLITVLVLSAFLGIGSSLVLRQKAIRWPKIAHAANVLAQMLVAGIIYLFLSYVAASANYPLQDDLLQRLEGWIPLDWQEIVWLSNHYRLGGGLLGSYTLLQFLFLMPLALCLAGHVLRAYEFALILICTLAVTILISALVPAIGPYGAYDLDPQAYSHIVPIGSWGVDQMLAIREGSLRNLALEGMTGIITFPSFHAAGAVVFLWAASYLQRWRFVGWAAGGAMLASTPVIGGHYFIDVVAGGLVAILSIFVVKRFSTLLRAPNNYLERPYLGVRPSRLNT
jgi:membrane-associated phospholipid phosphatase